jgi:putative chitinase
LLLSVAPAAKERIPLFLAPLNDAAHRYDINTSARMAAFIAQIMHESGELKHVRELANGAAYEGRSDLGNTELGDGPRFRGRGLIQVTGRANYRKCGSALGVDFLSSPEKMEEPVYAALSAGWFWRERNLNELADRWEFTVMTRRINGGLRGYAERLNYLERANRVL